jgi:hypothetical protein
MGVVVRILVACLVVGLLLSFFAIDPRSLLLGGWQAFHDAWGMALSAASWAIPYVLLGATVVVPIALVIGVLRLLRRRDRGP